ncbi:zinc ABC transporter ATP-binding protein AztA [Arthrobacter sp. MDT3-44]
MLTDVWFDHDGVDVLCGVSVSIQPGAVTVIAGPNGAGKSTLLAVLAGVLAPRRGAVSTPRNARRALVVQRSEVSDRMPLTVRDVVTMGRWSTAGMLRRLHAEDRRIIDECIDLVGLAGHQSRPLDALSGGQRQRAFLAQGLAQRADIVLLDEPTTGLDATTRALVADVLIAEQARGATVVCVSHDDTTVAAADHIITLDAGRIPPDPSTPDTSRMSGISVASCTARTDEAKSHCSWALTNNDNCDGDAEGVSGGR